MGLDPIPVDVYADFAIRLFEERDKHIGRDVIEEVWNMFNGYTWFVQMMMNELFALTNPKETCTSDMIDDARHNVIMSQ